MAGKSKSSKRPDGRPARKRYWANGHLRTNKLRRMMKHNKVYSDPAISEEKTMVTGKDKIAREVVTVNFMCPECKTRTTMMRVKAHAGYCPGGECKYKVKTRPLTETEAKGIWRDTRKRHVA